MSHARPTRKVGLSTCRATARWRGAALCATILATVASAAGVVVGLALGGAPAVDAPPAVCSAPVSGAARATVRVAAPASGGASAAPDVTELPSRAGSVGAPPSAGLPAPAGVVVRPPAGRSGEPRRTRAQRLVAAQLDAMIAHAGEPVPDASVAGGDTDPSAEAFPDPASGELQQETARAVLAGMLEGFAGVPARAQGSPDTATEP